MLHNRQRRWPSRSDPREPGARAHLGQPAPSCWRVHLCINPANLSEKHFYVFIYTLNRISFTTLTNTTSCVNAPQELTLKSIHAVIAGSLPCCHAVVLSRAIVCERQYGIAGHASVCPASSAWAQRCAHTSVEYVRFNCHQWTEISELNVYVPSIIWHLN